MTTTFELPAMRHHRWRQLFRAKRHPDGRWVHGDLANTVRITTEADHRCVRIAGCDIDEDTIGIFSGFHDRDDEPIYSGDVIRYRDYDGSGGMRDFTETVTFTAGIFGTRSAFLCDIPDPLIIGNIYDNPQLNNNGKLL